MILFPGNLVEADAFQEVDDILAAEVMRLAAGILRHEDDRHIGEKGRDFLPESQTAGCILRDDRLDDDNGKGDTLLDDDGSLYDQDCLLGYFDIALS